MNDIAIAVRNLSKKYRLYESPQHRLKEALNPFRKKYHRDFWALENVSFEIGKGEIVGIIGKNGAGKSTLLKIITVVVEMAEGVNLEVTEKGEITGIEILDASKKFPLKSLFICEYEPEMLLNKR